MGTSQGSGRQSGNSDTSVLDGVLRSLDEMDISDVPVKGKGRKANPVDPAIAAICAASAAKRTYRELCVTDPQGGTYDAELTRTKSDVTKWLKGRGDTEKPEYRTVNDEIRAFFASKGVRLTETTGTQILTLVRIVEKPAQATAK